MHERLATAICICPMATAFQVVTTNSWPSFEEMSKNNLSKFDASNKLHEINDDVVENTELYSEHFEFSVSTK